MIFFIQLSVKVFYWREKFIDLNFYIHKASQTEKPSDDNDEETKLIFFYYWELLSWGISPPPARWYRITLSSEHLIKTRQKMNLWRNFFGCEIVGAAILELDPTCHIFCFSNEWRNFRFSIWVGATFCARGARKISPFRGNESKNTFDLHCKWMNEWPV